MKRKILIVIGILLLLGGTITYFTTKESNKTFIKETTESTKNVIAAYVIQEDGTYKEVESIPQEGYQLNTSKSTCSNGTIPGWDVKNKRFYADNLTKGGTSCYLYFDKYVPTASETILTNITIKTDTPDFSQIATTDEGVYATEDGMYGGTSYYWRGAATTNHVMFANKCWRIVRINGDKSIRLIYNGTIQSGNTCTGNGANSEAVIMGATDAEKYYATSDRQYYNSSYVGWTYTLSTQRTTGGTNSNAKTQTEKWYDSNITGTNLNKVDTRGKFCNDRNVTEAPSSWDSGFATTWSATGTKFAYAAAKRLFESYTPTLNCSPGDVYALKVGAITADEVEFAGGKNENNPSYYLYTGQNYWTISPADWYDGAHVFVVNSNGYLNSFSVSNSTYGLRPVINLHSDITFSSGNGTLDNPYVVS